MINTIEIQVFISCPGDVEVEKKIVEDVCKILNDSVMEYCNFRFYPREWKSIVGHVGERPQTIINNKIKEYDIYIGILWMRFGSRTGAINEYTGEEFESGTQEEFYLAYDNWKNYKMPRIFLFNKEPKATLRIEETEQLLKVQKFIDDQRKNEWVNKFKDDLDFQSQVFKVLNEKLYSLCLSNKIEMKRQILNVDIEEEISKIKIRLEKVPTEYVERSISHFSSAKENQVTNYLKFENESLDKLILREKRIILLGDAGSGKSTELRNLFFKLNRKDSPFIPIFQSLNIYTQEQRLENFLPEFWSKVPESSLIIIWDGLDEIQPDHFNTVIRQITNFAEKHSQLRIVISCRMNFYELPINNSPGTLIGFEPYILNDLDDEDVKKYYSLKYSNVNTDDFIKGALKYNLTDLITKPFFLMLLAENFNNNIALSENRAKLYDMFLLSRIKFDEHHFKGTFNVRGKEHEIFHLLEKIALSMEILCRNFISESDILEIIKEEDFENLKYCTAFKKKDGEEYLWQFEHNSIQEYLAAKALSNLEFDKVIKFLTFEPQNKKLIPSWINTLSFLFSILQTDNALFQKLLQWLLDNEKEVIVKFEPDKVLEKHRKEIFKSIFNYYKKNDVWIDSNKFSYKDLANFGQSEENIKFLIGEIKDERNTKTVKLNAISLIGHFDYDLIEVSNEVEKLLLDQIEVNIKDPHFIHTTIYALKWAGFISKSTIDRIMYLVGKRKNQYIRSSIYSILNKSDYSGEFIDYLLEGYRLINDKTNDDRDRVSLIDEEWNLNNCVKEIKSPQGIKKIIEYVSQSTIFYYGYDTDKVLNSIIKNTIDAYYQDNSVYESVLNWFLNDARAFRSDMVNFHIKFFQSTGTREKAFYEIWEMKEDKLKDKFLVIARLINPILISFIIEKYNKHYLNNKELEDIYFYMLNVRNEVTVQFADLLKEKAGYELIKPVKIDYEKIREHRLKESFNLLFDRNELFKETMRVFEDEGKDSLSNDNLFQIRKENYKIVEMEDNYFDCALRLLKVFVNKGQIVNKEIIKSWFEKIGNEEWFRVSLIYEYLLNYKFIEISNDQKIWIIKWCHENVSKVNFRYSIEVYSDGRTTYKTMALYIWYFTRRLNISYKKEILLDMLSFDAFEGNSWVGIEYLIQALDKDDIIARMLENLRIGIPDDSVLKNHINYIVQNKATEGYPIILNEIQNTKRQAYFRIEILDIYLEHTKDISGIKNILPKADSEIKWEIVNRLKLNDETLFIEKYLLSELTNNNNSKEIEKTAEVLVSLQNMKGLKYYVDWIKGISENDIESIRADCLKSLRAAEALPFLIELLELSYERKLTVDGFEIFNSRVIEAFYNIALVSSENFNKVKITMENFLNSKKLIYDDVKYLRSTIDRMEEQFYMNRAQSYTINEVREKLQMIY